MNTIDGDSLIAREAETTKWFYHPTDKSIDVAVININLNRVPNIDYRVIEPSMFAVQENLKVHEMYPGVGDEVYITGLFIRHHGSKKNVPIVRAGNIAVMPDKSELIKTKGDDIEAYLIESRSFGGLSGSPCFVYLTRPNIIGAWHIYLLGLVHGHWDLPDESQMDTTLLAIDGTGKINTGIAVVVPAEHILETINQPELLTVREAAFKIVDAKNATTQD